MRKIISKTDEKRRNRINQLFIGGILILVMVLSVLGYSLGRDNEEQNEKISYNGFEFVKQNGRWILSRNEFKFSFKYNPNEVDKVESTLNLINNYANKPLYISSTNYELNAEIYNNIVYPNQIAQRMQEACLEGEICEESLPVKTCADNFIILKESDEESIKQQDNCVFIKGKKENLVKLTDSALFKIIGIQ